MKKALYIIYLTLLTTISCKNANESTIQNLRLPPVHDQTSFFGDNTLTVISSEKINGYDISLFRSDDITAINFKRGDSINVYVAMAEFPHELDVVSLDTVGVITRDLTDAFPNSDKMDADWPGICFFMDVNFDGERDFVISHRGYNRIYYACFDLVNGNQHNPCPGFLTPMDEEPYNNLVGGLCGETTFDYDKKTIHISEQMGCCSHVETWCKLIPGKFGEKDKVKVIRREESDYYANDNGDRIQYRDIYQLQNDTLKFVERINSPC